MIKRWQMAAFLAYVFFTFFDNTVQWYTHAQSYPLSALVGPNEFDIYGNVYEQRLLFALYIPYFVLVLSNIALIARPVFNLPRSAFVVTLILNLSILFISLLLAVPMHTEHGLQGFITPEQLDRLLQVNALRLGVAFASSGIVLWMLSRLLRPWAQGQIMQSSQK